MNKFDLKLIIGEQFNQKHIKLYFEKRTNEHHNALKNKHFIKIY